MKDHRFEDRDAIRK